MNLLDIDSRLQVEESMQEKLGVDWVEILSGLEAGEAVVLDPGNLRTGQAVSVAESRPLQTTRANGSSDP